MQSVLSSGSGKINLGRNGMRSNSSRGTKLVDEIPYRKNGSGQTGIQVQERIEYRGADIIVYRRDIGVAGPRIAYTARVHIPEVQKSTFISYVSNLERIVEMAKDFTDKNVKPAKPKFMKLVSRQRLWELWYDDANTGVDTNSNSK